MAICPRFSNMYGLKEMLRRDFEGKHGLTTSDTDRVMVIVGFEGSGKSRLGLKVFDFYYKELLKKTDYDQTYITYFAANKKEFVNALRNSQKFYMICHDEAIKDLYSREGSKRFAKQLNKAYAIIRGKNLYTVLILPNILNLDKFFREWRVKSLLHVYARGKFAYYGPDKLNRLLPSLDHMSKSKTKPNISQARDLENWQYIPPDFTDTFTNYDGPLLAPYMERKEKNMTQVINELDEDFDAEEEESKPKARGTESQIEAYRDAVRDRFFGRGEWAGSKMKKKDIIEELNISHYLVTKALTGAPEFRQKSKS